MIKDPIFHAFLVGLLCGTVIWIVSFHPSLFRDGKADRTTQAANKRLLEALYRNTQRVNHGSELVDFHCIIICGKNDESKANEISLLLKTHCDNVTIFKDTKSLSGDLHLLHFFANSANLNSKWYLIMKTESLPVIDNIRSVTSSYNYTYPLYIGVGEKSLVWSEQPDLIISNSALQLLSKNFAAGFGETQHSSTIQDYLNDPSFVEIIRNDVLFTTIGFDVFAKMPNSGELYKDKEKRLPLFFTNLNKHRKLFNSLANDVKVMD